MSTIVWAFIVRLVSGYSPSMYSYQQSLPRMPVPPLKVTLEKLIESLEPLYDRDSEELQAIRKHSKVGNNNKNDISFCPVTEFRNLAESK